MAISVWSRIAGGADFAQIRVRTPHSAAMFATLGGFEDMGIGSSPMGLSRPNKVKQSPSELKHKSCPSPSCPGRPFGVVAMKGP